MRRNLRWVLPAIVLIAVVAFLLVAKGEDSDPLADDYGTSGAQDGSAAGETSPAMLEARDSLLGSAQEVDLTLTVRVPPGSDADDDDEQELDASGTIDLAGGVADLDYDFNGLNNAGGFLGHFEEINILWIDGVGYLDVFSDGPQWVQVEPGDAVGTDIDRLRDVIVTTPLGIPGVLGAPGEGDDSSRDVAVPSLVASEDAFVSQVGAALEELGADTIEVQLADDGDISVGFTYPAPDSPTKEMTVNVVYTFVSRESGPEVQAPDASEVRQFSDIFG